MNLFSNRIFLCLLLAASALRAQSAAPDTLADSTRMANPAMEIRGLERDQKSALNPVRATLNGIFWLPRVTIETLISTAGVGAVLIDENRIVQKFGNIFLFNKRRMGWFPILNAVTGFPRGYGLRIFYRDRYHRASLRAAYADEEIWGVRMKAGTTFFRHNHIWMLNSVIRLETYDRYRYFGLGKDPQNDPRNHFLSNAPADYGLFQQHHIMAEFSLGIRPSPDWQAFFKTYYIFRDLGNPSDTYPENLVNVFEAGSLPGVGATNSQIYPELSLEIDTREELQLATGGFRGVFYSGLAFDSDGGGRDLLRAGADISLFKAILHNNRFVIPRLIFDMVEPLGSGPPIAITDFPRHQSFRGVDRKALLRSDRYMVTSSLEYQWPLTPILQGQLFYDRVGVARQLTDFDWRKSPWAVGLGLAFQTRYAEIARAYLSYGSEGIYAKLAVGWSSRYRDRGDWH